MAWSFPKKVALRHLVAAPVVAMTRSGIRDVSLAELNPRPLLFPSFIKGVPPHWRNSPPSVRIFVPLESYVHEMRAMQRSVQNTLQRIEKMRLNKR